MCKHLSYYRPMVHNFKGMHCWCDTRTFAPTNREKTEQLRPPLDQKKADK